MINYQNDIQPVYMERAARQSDEVVNFIKVFSYGQGHDMGIKICRYTEDDGHRTLENITMSFEKMKMLRDSLSQCIAMMHDYDDGM